MAKLILTFNGQLVGYFPVNKPVITIGRKADNDIRIDNLAVSSHHARIRLDSGACILEDLQSTNGTYHNGERITRHILVNGAVINIAKYKLQY